MVNVTATGPRKVLFVCVGNSCRSQMAEGFARYYGGARVEARSGGTLPTGHVDPDAIRVMAERGIDISGQRSGVVDWAFAREADQVITMGCGADEACPAGILARVEDWGLEDPKGKGPAEFRRVRNEIEARVLGLVRRVAVPPVPVSAKAFSP